MGKCSLSPRANAISSFFWSVVNLTVVIWAVTEKMRWTPFHQEMQCDTPPTATAMRLSKLSMPSPLAESMFMQPGTAPFGLYINMTTRTKCTNPGQPSITMKAAGSETELLSPNMSDVAIGGYGLPFSTSGKAMLSKDVHFASGGGQGEMVTHTQVAQSLADVLAGMSPASTIAGYSPSYTRSFQKMETCSTILGMTTCQEVTAEQFCGSFGGSCFVEALDAAGEALVPQQFEPAICGYTRSLCGKEEDVLRQLKPDALGIQVVATVPCHASTGLPNGTMCNVITAPGIDPNTRMPRALEITTELTPEAEAEKEELLASAEAAVGSMILMTIILNSFFLVLNLSLGFFCCRRHYRAQAQAKETAEASQPEAPTLMTSTAQGNGDKSDKSDNSDKGEGEATVYEVDV